LQATHKKKSEVCPWNEVPAVAMTSASDEKWRPFNFFFQSGRAKDLSASRNYRIMLHRSMVQSVVRVWSEIIQCGISCGRCTTV